MKIATLQRRGTSRAITLPAAYLKQLKWTLGELLVLEIVDGELIVYPLVTATRQPKPHSSRTKAAANA